jgi:hypothetical protein
MANSKLLKEAIADAKAVKETALANAKIALEEAFTPRLQSILSQKMRAEAEVEDKEAEKVDEELSSTGIGSKVDAGYAETPGATPSYDAMTDLSVGVKKDSGKPEQAGTDYKKVADISEEENPFADDAMDGDKDAEIAELKARLAELEGEDSEEENPFAKAEGEDEMGMDDMSMDSEMGDDSMDMDSDDEESEDDMDLEAIIRELEASIKGDDETEEGMYEAEEEDEEAKNENLADGSEAGTDKGETPKVVVTNEAEEDDKDVVDLEEILREMEADMKDDKDKVDEEKEEDEKEMKVELNEAYKVIKSLQKTINEVNLLNAKLLFANKLFRAHNMTNEQKVKVIETLDRTNSVREVKLVYSTLAENFKFSTNKSTKKSISEGIASKVTKSTKPAQSKQVIAENTDFSDRFKKLAGIIK